MLRYQKPATDFLGILDAILLFREFIDGKRQGNTVMFHLMEYHLDPELQAQLRVVEAQIAMQKAQGEIWKATLRQSAG